MVKQTLKFQAIEFNNYRPYKNSVLEFSQDPKKTITIVEGRNAAGKTSIVHGIEWCLYGEEKIDAVVGSRFIYANYTRSHNILNKIGNKILTLIFNLLYNTTFTDIYSCYFAFKKDLIDANSLQTEGFEQHAEILCKVIKKGNKFYEVPISYNGRNVSEGKKIKAHHFFIVLFEIIKRRFV